MQCSAGTDSADREFGNGGTQGWLGVKIADGEDGAGGKDEADDEEIQCFVGTEQMEGMVLV